VHLGTIDNVLGECNFDPHPHLLRILSSSFASDTDQRMVKPWLLPRRCNVYLLPRARGIPFALLFPKRHSGSSWGRPFSLLGIFTISPYVPSCEYCEFFKMTGMLLLITCLAQKNGMSLVQIHRELSVIS
jgi:hypothetical protein